MFKAILATCDCEGWWEQPDYGRQPMEQLWISFHDGRIQGAGADIIGPFVLSGIVTEEGAVAIHKQYLQQHGVEYLGSYDGEGVLAGEWQISGYIGGRWMIRIRRLTGAAAASSAADIPEYSPSK